jgi:hypothetical protein
LIWFAAQCSSLYLAAGSADCCCFCSLRNIAAAGRTFHKTAARAFGLARLATQIAAFYLAAMSAKLNTLSLG